jgi:site-specific recombinase XerD
MDCHDQSTNDWNARLGLLRGAYAENTIRGYRADFADFDKWCDATGIESLPASPDTVATYLEQVAVLKTPSTVSRRMAAIGRIHRLLGHPNPAASDVVSLAVRRIVRSKGRRQKQAAGLSARLRDKLILACGDDLRGLRDQALIAVGYDTLCRRSELVQLRAEDIERLAAGDASILIRRSKTDQAGDGRLAYLSAGTVTKIDRWVAASGIGEGPLFRALYYSTVGARALHSYTVTRILKTLGKKAGLDSQLCASLSGHSMRVGAALDMAENGIDLVPIMHAGGWKSPNMVVRYTQQISLRKSGMAQLHAKWQRPRVSVPSTSRAAALGRELIIAGLLMARECPLSTDLRKSLSVGCTSEMRQ